MTPRNSVPRLTIDPDLLQPSAELDRDDRAAALRLLSLHEDGRCEMRLARPIRKAGLDEPLRSRVRSLLPLRPVELGGDFLSGRSSIIAVRFSLEDIAVKELTEELQVLLEFAEELAPLLYPEVGRGAGRKTRARHRKDAARLVAHRRDGRDIFVTRDSDILANRAMLLKRHAITVMGPVEAVGQVERRRDPATGN
ncbi:MAG TPA: hypothetical protein ENO23_08195 [Alphaproteobacteria bacterium]|nr:hypothetical protein [Alphaproteobacteria bacterium]